jgi:molybdopterin-guanine dinucleotide biosynthesis protein A
MIGLVLCGGKSSRMGTDKGLLKTGLNGLSWAQHAGEQLTALGLPVVYSVNISQAEMYKQQLPAATLVPDNPSVQAAGPLLGLLTTHLFFPQHDLFVLACDMPAMQHPVLMYLLTQYRKTTALLYLFRHTHPEPLCGIYTAAGLAHILSLLQQDALTGYGLQYIASLLHTCYVPVPDAWVPCFTNCNAPGDIARYQ